MPIREFTCKKCEHHWDEWRGKYSSLPKRPKCPKCGSRATKQEIVGNLPNTVLFRGAGWTPKAGNVKDLREVKGFDDPRIASELEG
jgi:putative FmdB family regulatory protein